MIKEEYDPVTQSVIPKKYFSGGAIVDAAELVAKNTVTQGALSEGDLAEIKDHASGIQKVRASFNQAGEDQAKKSDDDQQGQEHKLTEEDRKTIMDALIKLEKEEEEWQASTFKIEQISRFILGKDKVKAGQILDIQSLNTHLKKDDLSDVFEGMFSLGGIENSIELAFEAMIEIDKKEALRILQEALRYPLPSVRHIAAVTLLREFKWRISKLSAELKAIFFTALQGYEKLEEFSKKYPQEVVMALKTVLYGSSNEEGYYYDGYDPHSFAKVLLTKIGIPAIPMLLEAAQNNNTHTRGEAITALIKIRKLYPETRPQIRDSLRQNVLPLLLDQIKAKDLDKYERWCALNDLQEIGDPQPEVIAVLKESLHDSNRDVREKSKEVLSILENIKDEKKEQDSALLNGDKGMGASDRLNKKYGGIDMNPTMAKMDVAKAQGGEGVSLPAVDQGAIAHFNAHGLTPFILQVTPINDVLPLIGLK